MIPVQFITHQTDRYTYLEGARLALRGGCRWIQLRMKEASDDAVLAIACELRRDCNEAGAALVLNDRVHLVTESQADGVHLGKTDMPVAEARQQLGEEALIGGTANTFADIEALCAANVDYIGCGPYRFTATKKQLAPVLGIEGYRTIMEQMRRAGMQTRVFAIGGIEYKDIPLLIAAGVYGIAVSGAALRVEHPDKEMTRLIETEFQSK